MRDRPREAVGGGQAAGPRRPRRSRGARRHGRRRASARHLHRARGRAFGRPDVGALRALHRPESDALPDPRLPRCARRRPSSRRRHLRGLRSRRPPIPARPFRLRGRRDARCGCLAGRHCRDHRIRGDRTGAHRT
ncbi:MAG: hypothetical protein E6J85_16245 [Deltaproteobacteria bacterium]|nr:MAG: hypothetical protein E6J85_16245 [Deltaproteobacteria bacterium]